MFKSIIASVIICVGVLFFFYNHNNEKEPTFKPPILSEQKLSEIDQLRYDLIKESINNGHSKNYIPDNKPQKGKIGFSKEEQNCLARNIYFEAGIEPYEGKLAVAQVTYNRLKTGRWGNTVCDVTKAKSQFSWTLQKKRKSPMGILWEQSQEVAQDFINGVRLSEVGSSLHYHADYVNPHWNRNKIVVAQIGRHIFYEK